MNMKIKYLVLTITMALGGKSAFATSPCEGQTTYQTGWFVPPSSAIFSRSPLGPLGLPGTTIMGMTTFPNGVLMIQWPTSPTNYLLLPMDYPVPDAIASGALKASQEGHQVLVNFCFDPTNSGVRLIDYVLFSR